MRILSHGGFWRRFDSCNTARVKISHLSEATLFPHEFHTAKPPRPLYCHQEFLDKLEARRNEPTGKRAALLMQRMAVDIARLHYKGASGANRGWRRSRLGGGSGFHFYAWWAPAGRRRSNAARDSGPSQKQSSFATSGTMTIMRRYRRATPTKTTCPSACRIFGASITRRRRGLSRKRALLTAVRRRGY